MRQLQLPEYDWKLVQKLAKKTNPLVLWGRTTGLPGNFKRDVTKKLTQEQCERCAYCGCYLFEEFPHRDHIAPKESYSQWTFLPENLVLACYACNTDSKKTYNPVLIRKAKYKKCTFRFVHPYLDNPNHHLEFVGAVSGVIIRKKTFKGEETIKLFGLASPERTKQRAKDALSDAAKSKLHGQWLTLFEDVTMSKAGMVLVPR